MEHLVPDKQISGLLLSDLTTKIQNADIFGRISFYNLNTPLLKTDFTE
jgi:hypothetical protein